MTAAIEHKCTEWLKHRDVGGVSSEGEPYFEDWWECVICREKFTAEEAAQLFVDAEARK